jgi:two-component system, cell cycle sensor histidine kinase and response regulator CckA
VVRRNLCEMLERFGYRVLSASEGREALDIWEQEKNNVALLFSDMVMPGGMSGLELAERLRAEKQGLKIVITSGYSREIAEQTQSALSGVGFLSKPFDSSDLGVMIRSMLDRRN